jgi:hypothetical protein
VYETKLHKVLHGKFDQLNPRKKGLGGISSIGSSPSSSLAGSAGSPVLGSISGSGAAVALSGEGADDDADEGASDGFGEGAGDATTSGGANDDGTDADGAKQLPHVSRQKLQASCPATHKLSCKLLRPAM